ncbi:MAG: phosphoribosylglycinamide formyltransferase [Spirochaetia bacterium]
MAKAAFFASGSGSNFQAIAEELEKTNHAAACLICDKPQAKVIDRARNFGIPVHIVSYKGKKRIEAEAEIHSILDNYAPDLLVLAGYMRILTPSFVDRYPQGIVNIHPSLLPKHPGTHAIEKSYNSSDSELGITIHWVDHGTDTGPVITQKSIQRMSSQSLEETEERIHQLEHTWYPKTIIQLLNSKDQKS